jgi:D-alanine transaminase
MIVYFNGKYLPLDEVKISPNDRGFHFADGVYETLRSYKGKIFHFDSHMRRLNYSLSELNINVNDLNVYKPISLNLARINNILPKDFSVYIQITRGNQFPRRHNYDDNLTSTLFISVSKLNEDPSRLKKGVKVILEKDIRWTRCDIKSISLLPAILANKKAIGNNAYEAILYRDDLITEGSHTNFFGVKEGVVYTTPLSNFILEGITREVIIGLCKKYDIKVTEEYIKVSELKSFDEFFITGTTTEVTPVVQIDDWVAGDGLPGKITKSIQKLFKDLTDTK